MTLGAIYPSPQKPKLTPLVHFLGRPWGRGTQPCQAWHLIMWDVRRLQTSKQLTFCVLQARVLPCLSSLQALMSHTSFFLTFFTCQILFCLWVFDPLISSTLAHCFQIYAGLAPLALLSQYKCKLECLLVPPWGLNNSYSILFSHTNLPWSCVYLFLSCFALLGHMDHEGFSSHWGLTQFYSG